MKIKCDICSYEFTIKMLKYQNADALVENLDPNVQNVDWILYYHPN